MKKKSSPKMSDYLSINFWIEFVRENRRELIFYGAIGVMGVVVDFASFFALLFFSMPTIYAQWIASLIGSTHNHFWHHYRVFDHNQRFKRTYSIAMAISFISVVLSGPMLVWVDTWFDMLWLSKIVVIGFFTILQYILRRKIVFIKD